METDTITIMEETLVTLSDKEVHVPGLYFTVHSWIIKLGINKYTNNNV